MLTLGWLSPFPLFIQSRVPAFVVVTPTFRVSLPTSVNPKHPHRHTQWCLAQSGIILGPVKLLIKTGRQVTQHVLASEEFISNLIITRLMRMSFILGLWEAALICL